MAEGAIQRCEMDFIVIDFTAVQTQHCGFRVKASLGDPLGEKQLSKSPLKVDVVLLVQRQLRRCVVPKSPHSVFALCSHHCGRCGVSTTTRKKLDQDENVAFVLFTNDG